MADRTAAGPNESGIDSNRSATLADLFAEVKSIESIFGTMEWAEDEIKGAQQRHWGAADAIWHSFRLVNPTHPLLQTSERMYRAHCREILDRVAAQSDTRPGTAAEICCAASEASKVAPLNTRAFGLYARMFDKVFPGEFPGQMLGDHLEHVEALHGEAIDALEAEACHRLAQSERILTEVQCAGWHAGEPVTCSYQTPS